MQQIYSPMAQAVQSRGRGEDTMLVHMTPGEVGGLQQLALATGGSLTINPDTGLPEAGWLGRLLPTIIGIAGAAVGIPTWALAGGTALGQTALTGDLGKGLMAGLGAFGGASLAGGLGVGKAGETATKLATEQTAGKVAELGSKVPTSEFANALSGTGTPSTAMTAFQKAAEEGAKGPGFFDKFGAMSKAGLPGGIIGKAAPYAAGLGLAGGLGAFEQPKYEVPEQKEEPASYPTYAQRTVDPRIPEGPAYDQENYGGELSFFDPAGFQRTGYDTIYRAAEGDTVPAPQGGLAAALPEYTRMFQTSPGAVTGVPFGYGAGQAPSEIIRADMAAKAAQRQAAADAEAAEKTAQAQAEADAAAAQQTAVAPAFNIDYSGLGFLGSIPEVQQQLGIGTPVTTTPASPVEPIIAEQIYTPVTPGGEYQFDIARGVAKPTNTSSPVNINPFGFLPFASGGPINMESGGFVMPARETAEFGNGSTMAGQRRLAEMGGMPIRGRGDGVSDSIPASIDGQQRAALANGETYFPPQAVKRLGGADKLRNMMQAATRSRQNTARGGQNTIRGLA